MLSKKTKRRFVWLGIASLLLWIFNTFGLIAIDYANKGGGVFGLRAVSKGSITLTDYQSALATIHMLIFSAIPSIAASYLLIGLFIFHFVAKAKNDDHDA